MTLRVWATWLPSALFLLQATGCWSLSGPHTVRGTVGGSLSVQCRYEEEKFRENNKYWCESPCLRLLKKKIVETTRSEREVRNGRVSIRDHPANLTFIVTLERLTKRDEGKYWCAIDASLSQRILDPKFEVEVIVSPAPTPTRKIFTSTLGPPSSSLPATTLLYTTRPETPDPHQHPRWGDLCMWKAEDTPFSWAWGPPEPPGLMAALPRVHSPNPQGQLLAGEGPAQQRPLPAPGLPEAAPVPEHAGGCPLGEQASAGLCNGWAASF
ncbi:CMRF35-like molecule 6 isoform X1 [Artibeus jamaicensis]|uniref:CMRF35-like molecule 6 isoform X1 n=1 Tax=Artibeus jamaicensis TaxID=9417 RepID=UPI00235ABF50|nr:CMRF35-like molecule 6 isoform X1 [Artibeus jamaicensis]